MKKFIALILTLLLMFSITGCAEKSMTFDIEETNTIQITIGEINEAVTITDGDFCEKITENINTLEFEKGDKAVGQIGWSYTLTWLNENGDKITSIIIVSKDGSSILLDGYYYTIKDGNKIDTTLILEQLN